MHPWPLQGAAAQRFPSLARWRLNRSFHSVSPVFLRQATHHPGEAQDARGIQRFDILSKSALSTFSCGAREGTRPTREWRMALGDGIWCQVN